MLGEYLRRRRRNKELLRYAEGFNWVAGALLRGKPPGLVERDIMACPSGDFARGALDALLQWGRVTETLR